MYKSESQSDNRKTLREKRLSNILFANSQELTEEGWKFARKSLELRTPLEAAVDINTTQNNMLSSSPLLFVEVTRI